MKNKIDFGKRLREYREHYGFTQEYVAQRAGMRANSISVYETGAKSDPKLSTVIRICDALGCTVGELLDD